MAKNTVPRGETSVIRHVFIQDSASTTGGGKTGLAYNTASLTSYFLYPGGTLASLTLETITTLGTYAAPTSAAHLRFKEVDATNMPGWYELQFHNDWFSVANARRAASLQLKGATGMVPLNMEIDIIGMLIQSATPEVAPVPAISAAIATDAGNSATSFKTTLTETTNDFWKDCLIKITSGTLAKQVKRVSAYNGTTKVVTVVGGFTGIPADGVTFDLINQ